MADPRRLALLGAGAAVLAGSPAASGSGAPAKDSFTFHITSASGDYRGDQGGGSLRLRPSSSSARVRPVTVRISGQPCLRARCIQLAGTVLGALTDLGTRPDTGRRFALKANGNVAPLGRVTATGTVAGTGFIRSGRESLRITLSSPHGDVVLAGTSAPVPGFTSP